MCRDPQQIKIRAKCINDMATLIVSCIPTSEQKSLKDMSNVLVKINAEFCKATDFKVNSTIPKMVAAISQQGMECMRNNLNHVKLNFIFINYSKMFIIIYETIRFSFVHYQQLRIFLKTRINLLLS